MVLGGVGTMVVRSFCTGGGTAVACGWAAGDEAGEDCGELGGGVRGVTVGPVDSRDASAAVMVIIARPWQVSSQQMLRVCSPSVASCGTVTGSGYCPGRPL